MLEEILQCTEEMEALQDSAGKSIDTVATANKRIASGLARAAGKPR